MFEEAHPGSFVEAGILDIVDGMTSSNLLPTDSRATYKCYIHVRKRVMKIEVVLSLVVSQEVDTPVAEMLGITYRDDRAIYTST